MDNIKEEQDKLKYEEIIKEFILKRKDLYKINDIKNISISFKRLGGGMNKNYLIEIENKENNKTNKFFFRYFGELINDIFDRKKEAEIIKKLGEEGYGPKLLEFDYINEKYRIDEYLDDTRELLYEEVFNENIINDLNIIINKYSQISDIYKYEFINKDSKNIINLVKAGEGKFNISTNIYDNIINYVYNKSKENF